MQFTFAPMDEATARAIRQWRYDGPYAAYNAENDAGDVSEELDRRSPYVAVRDETGSLVGFFSFGTSAEVSERAAPTLYGPDRSIAVGLGLRPDLTGQGLGLAFVEAGLAFAREHYAPASFRLYVLSWNERAIRVYERAGFTHVRVFRQRNIHGENEFVEMTRPA
jgi:[ribosomal protein S18]-alanine N-acetyltransferase